MCGYSEIVGVHEGEGGAVVARIVGGEAVGAVHEGPADAEGGVLIRVVGNARARAPQEAEGAAPAGKA